LGHRGARNIAPENTLLAFEQALQQGADGVELDVRLSADEHPVVIHDPTLTRVTNARESQRVRRLSFAALQKIEIGQGQTLPSLREAVHWANKRQAKLNIELKSNGGSRIKLVDAVLQVLAQVPPRSPILFSTFDVETLRLVAKARNGFDAAWLVDTPTDLERAPELLAELGVSSVNPEHHLLNSAAIKQLSACGLTINTWTVNSESRAAQLAREGVHSIITDEPLAIRAAVERAQGGPHPAS
jgi:glycerophosphoryl diester phosphodiesterase